MKIRYSIFYAPRKWIMNIGSVRFHDFKKIEQLINDHWFPDEYDIKSYKVRQYIGRKKGKEIGLDMFLRSPLLVQSYFGEL